MSTPDLLAGKIAVVAGGGRGIGEATATALAGEGATVVVLDIEAERAEAVRDTIVSAGGQAGARTVDLLDGAQLDSALKGVVAELGQIDVLVNVAGGMSTLMAPQPLHEWTDEQWDLIVSLNLTYVFKACRAVLPGMMAAGGGSIVNIASMLGLLAAPRMSAYGASKAAIISLTRTLAVEYGRYGVRVNAVAPGIIETPATSGSSIKGTFEKAASMVPLQRRGAAQDIARAVVFLAAPSSEYVTGQILPVDGGASLRFTLPVPGADISEASV